VKVIPHPKSEHGSGYGFVAEAFGTQRDDHVQAFFSALGTGPVSKRGGGDELLAEVQLAHYGDSVQEPRTGFGVEIFVGQLCGRGG
jgi:hypothetical protein